MTTDRQNVHSQSQNRCFKNSLIFDKKKYHKVPKNAHKGGDNCCLGNGQINTFSRMGLHNNTTTGALYNSLLCIVCTNLRTSSHCFLFHSARCKSITLESISSISPISSMQLKATTTLLTTVFHGNIFLITKFGSTCYASIWWLNSEG